MQLEHGVNKRKKTKLKQIKSVIKRELELTYSGCVNPNVRQSVAGISPDEAAVATA